MFLFFSITKFFLFFLYLKNVDKSLTKKKEMLQKKALASYQNLSEGEKQQKVVIYSWTIQKPFYRKWA